MAFDPFWGPKMGRFWPPALGEQGEGGGISTTKRGNEVISFTGNANSKVLITASLSVETNIWLLLEVLFPVLLGGRSEGVAGSGPEKKYFPSGRNIRRFR